MPRHDPTEALSDRMPMPVPEDYAARLNKDQLRRELSEARRVLVDHQCYDTDADGNCPVCFNLMERVGRLEALLQPTQQATCQSTSCQFSPQGAPAPAPAPVPCGMICESACQSMCESACQMAAQQGPPGPRINEDLLNDRMAPEDFHDLAKSLMGQEDSGPVEPPPKWASWKRVVAKVRVRLLRHFGQTQAGVRLDDIALQDSPSMVTVVFRTFSVRISADDFDQAGFNAIWRGDTAADQAENGMTNFIVERVLSAAENWKL